MVWKGETMITTLTTLKPAVISKGFVYCPICTHTVGADVVSAGRSLRVKAGQKCQRCACSLDAGYVIRLDQAA
jgi:DNA replicative helicase MCM subunit Mcm2 (Cdc46/Mcm family)